MKLVNNEIKKLFSGAVRFTEDENGLMPLRFTEEQSCRYGLSAKVYASAGMRFDFTTDAKEIRICYTSCTGSSRKFCYFDIYSDGILVQHCGTENRELQPSGILYLKTDGLPHRITIYLPNLCGVYFQDMELQDASFVKPVKRERKLLAYGDSITQGYDARYPSFSYINRIADHFNWELVNKAVGGDTFSPEMGSFGEDFIPDHIFIAYGTNDWSVKKKADFERDICGFFRNLRKRFPHVPIHVLLPIWREDCTRETFAGTLQNACDFIRGACSEYENIQVIDGFKLFPRLGSFFEDHYLHPNDIGFLLMADNVIRELEKEIK